MRFLRLRRRMQMLDARACPEGVGGWRIDPSREEETPWPFVVVMTIACGKASVNKVAVP